MQITTKKSNPLLLPTAALLVGLMGFRTWLPKEEAKLGPQRAELARLTADIQKMRSLNPAQIADVRAALERERAQVAAGEAQIPVTIETGPLLVRLDRGAKAHGLAAGTIVPIDRSSTANLGVAAATIAPYSGASYTVNLHGTWDGVVAMLRDWQHAEPMALPIIHSVKADQQQAGVLVAEVVFTIVTRPGTAPVSAPIVLPTVAPTAPPAVPAPAGSPPPVVRVSQAAPQSGATPLP